MRGWALTGWLVVCAVAVAAVAGFARADTGVLPDTEALPWTDPDHLSPLEQLANGIATTIAGRAVRVYCDGDNDWATLAANEGFDPEQFSELGRLLLRPRRQHRLRGRRHRPYAASYLPLALDVREGSAEAHEVPDDGRADENGRDHDPGREACSRPREGRRQMEVRHPHSQRSEEGDQARDHRGRRSRPHHASRMASSSRALLRSTSTMYGRFSSWAATPH